VHRTCRTSSATAVASMPACFSHASQPLSNNVSQQLVCVARAVCECVTKLDALLLLLLLCCNNHPKPKTKASVSEASAMDLSLSWRADTIRFLQLIDDHLASAAHDPSISLCASSGFQFQPRRVVHLFCTVAGL
jgi:hypothetical protein